MYCQKCGKPLAQTARFCPYCGTMQEYQQQYAVKASACQQYAVQPCAQKNKVFIAEKVLFGIALGAFLIAIIMGINAAWHSGTYIAFGQEAIAEYIQDAHIYPDFSIDYFSIVIMFPFSIISLSLMLPTFILSCINLAQKKENLFFVSLPLFAVSVALLAITILAKF